MSQNVVPLVVNEEHFMAAFHSGNKFAFKWLVNQLSVPLSIFAEQLIEDPELPFFLVSDSFRELFYQRNQLENYSELVDWLFDDISVNIRDYLVNNLDLQESDDMELKILSARIQSKILLILYEEKNGIDWRL